MVKMRNELAEIEKNNEMLLLIKRQYVIEIDRRKKLAEKESAKDEIKDKIESPLRRARNYATMSRECSCSPNRKLDPKE